MKKEMLILTIMFLGFVLFLSYKFISNPQISFLIGLASVWTIFFIKKKKYDKKNA
jgi:hypothetical protein